MDDQSEIHNRLAGAIVDDDSDMLPEQRPMFVQTDYVEGLLPEHVDRLALILDASP